VKCLRRDTRNRHIAVGEGGTTLEQFVDIFQSLYAARFSSYVIILREMAARRMRFQVYARGKVNGSLMPRSALLTTQLDLLQPLDRQHHQRGID